MTEMKFETFSKKQALTLSWWSDASPYYSAGLETVLEKYVRPYGITGIRQSCKPGGIPLTVSSGESAWRALEAYMRFSCGVSPRFLRDGTLLLGSEQGRRLKIGAETGVFDLSYSRRRYGVISEVLVKSKATGAVSRVLNQERLDEGGACRRIINVPRNTRFDAMRLTGEYQISASKEKERVIRLTLAEQFAAFPGDAAELRGVLAAPEGNYFVSETKCFGSETGAGTELILTGRAE